MRARINNSVFIIINVIIYFFIIFSFLSWFLYRNQLLVNPLKSKRSSDATRTSIASSSSRIYPAGLHIFPFKYLDSLMMQKIPRKKASSPLKTQQNNIIIPPSPSTQVANPISVSSNQAKTKTR